MNKDNLEQRTSKESNLLEAILAPVMLYFSGFNTVMSVWNFENGEYMAGASYGFTAALFLGVGVSSIKYLYNQAKK